MQLSILVLCLGGQDAELRVNRLEQRLGRHFIPDSRNQTVLDNTQIASYIHVLPTCFTLFDKL